MLMPLIGLSSTSSAASPQSLQDNNTQLQRTLSKRSVYNQKFEELLSQVSILQVRVEHIQTELQQLKQAKREGKNCTDINASQLGGCDEDILREFGVAIQNLKEKLVLENLNSEASDKKIESLRGTMNEYSYKLKNVEETCQENIVKITGSAYDIDNINMTINELESRLMKEVADIKSCMKATCGTTMKRSIGPPSYISKWFHMKAYDAKLSKVVIEHSLNELPAKVDVQIKSLSGADNDWIFPGASVYQADDDNGEDYGGVIYLYNETHVILTAPMPYNNDLGQEYIVTTGHRNEYYIGSHHYRYIEGLVRVRIWLMTDFPAPAYVSQWYEMDIREVDTSFHAISHGLSTYPGFVTLQVRSDGLVSESAGSSLLPVDYSNDGGVYYGVDDNMVRIWTAYIPSIAVYSGRLFGSGWDGWAGWNTFRHDTSQWTSGQFRVTVWDNESFEEANILIRQSNVMETRRGALTMPKIDIDNDIVSFYTKALDGPNQGFLFKGCGSSQAVRSPFGGVIYAYNKQGQFQTWRPNPKKQGYLININRPYGNGMNIQSSNSASYIAKLLKAKY